MRSADAPVRCSYPGPTESSAEVYEECLKDRERAPSQKNFGRIQVDSPESSANRQWQKTWRDRHPVASRNQTWLRRTAAKIQAQLLNPLPKLSSPDGPPRTLLKNFEELRKHENRLLRRILEDLKEAFRGEWETHADGQSRHIADMDWTIIWLPKTEELLNIYSIHCDLF